MDGTPTTLSDALAEIDRLHEVITALRARLRDTLGMTSIDVLRNAVQAEGGNWTVHRAALAIPERRLTPERLRQLLNSLADEGLLIKLGSRGRLWTLAERPAHWTR